VSDTRTGFTRRSRVTFAQQLRPAMTPSTRPTARSSQQAAQTGLISERDAEFILGAESTARDWRWPPAQAG